MPCIQCENGMWRWGEDGDCVYESREECEADNEPEDSAGSALRVDQAQLAAPRFFQSLADQVWAVQSPAVLHELAQIAQRQGSVHAIERRRGQRAEDARHVRIRDGVAIVPIMGPIFPRANLFTEISGATSLQTMAQDLQKMAERTDVKAVLLNVDSPGGVVTGVDEMAGMIAEVAAQKPVTAYVGGTGASAAYWLAAAANEIVVSRTGQVGSIGVVATIPKQQTPDEMGVMDFEIVSSNAPEKRPDPETSEGRRAVIERIDEIERIFIDSVAENRGVSRETVIKDFGRGNVMVGGVAVRRGMANRIGTFEETLARLQQTQPSSTSVAASAAAQDHSQAEETDMADPKKPAEAEAAAGSEPKPETAAPDKPKAADPAKVVEMCVAGGCPDMAAGLIREEASEEHVKAKIDAAGTIRERCESAAASGFVAREKAQEIAETAIKAGHSPDAISTKLLEAGRAAQSADEAVHSHVTPDTKVDGQADRGWDNAFAKVTGGKAA